MLLILSSDTHTHLNTLFMHQAPIIHRDAAQGTASQERGRHVHQTDADAQKFLPFLSLSFASGGIIFLRCSMCNVIPPRMPLAVEGFLYSFVLF